MQFNRIHIKWKKNYHQFIPRKLYIKLIIISNDIDIDFPFLSIPIPRWYFRKSTIFLIILYYFRGSLIPKKIPNNLYVTIFKSLIIHNNKNNFISRNNFYTSYYFEKILKTFSTPLKIPNSTRSKNPQQSRPPLSPLPQKKKKNSPQNSLPKISKSPVISYLRRSSPLPLINRAVSRLRAVWSGGGTRRFHEAGWSSLLLPQVAGRSIVADDSRVGDKDRGGRFRET